MRNILLITSLYPSNDAKFKNNTSVCHYFAKEWVKMGYKVRVIYLYNEYPLILYPLLKIAQGILAERVSTAILSERKHDEHSYLMDGINVTRIPIYKLKPHGDFSNNVIRSTTERIHKIIEDEGFRPNVILGHCILPSIRIVAGLKEIYVDAVTAVTIHGIESIKRQSVSGCFSKIDYLGYRSYPIKKSFENIYGERPYFMCFSGVPADYVLQKEKSFTNGIHDFIYVGNFMQRKYPSALVPAIASNYPEGDFSITYVGDGKGIKLIQKKASEYAIQSNIFFTGRIDRSEVTSYMDRSDVFIMISKAETFGLVYLEAMARGCITIASRNEGMDGIIVDGENGFLCDAGDSNELGSIIAKLKRMDSNTLQKISKNAIITAAKMTDNKMAEKYIKSVVL